MRYSQYRSSFYIVPAVLMALLMSMGSVSSVSASQAKLRGRVLSGDNADPTVPVCSSDLLLRFKPNGEYFLGSPYRGGGVSGAGFGITFDPDGNLWLGNFGFAGTGCTDLPPHNSVSKFSPDGTALSPDTGFTEGSISWA